MSPSGQKRKSESQAAMSAYPPKADIGATHVMSEKSYGLKNELRGRNAN
jgi:hypothetical protein